MGKNRGFDQDGVLIEFQDTRYAGTDRDEALICANGVPLCVGSDPVFDDAVNLDS